MAAVAACLVLLLALGSGCACSKLPFRSEDVLPALPHHVSWPVLNTLHNAVDLLPQFVAAVSPTSNVSTWKGACFYETQAWLEITETSGNATGGGVLYIETNERDHLYLPTPLDADLELWDQQVNTYRFCACVSLVSCDTYHESLVCLEHSHLVMPMMYNMLQLKYSIFFVSSMI
ncbi:hypothetical protein O6H91_Y581000 [Diphasiastrum complanatum]|nr:hypothetical protein O6H91_Y581000 [Diphasiastrum complanatum]